MQAPDIYNILMGEEKPTSTEGGNLVKEERNNTNLYSTLFLATSGGVIIAVKRYYSGSTADRRARKRTEGLEGVGRKVQRLQQFYSPGALRLPKRHNAPAEPGPLYHMETVVNRLREMGEQITDGCFSGMILTTPAP